MKHKILDLIEDEKWFPVCKVTKVELETSILLNKILDNLIEKIKKLEE